VILLDTHTPVRVSPANPLEPRTTLKINRNRAKLHLHVPNFDFIDKC